MTDLLSSAGEPGSHHAIPAEEEGNTVPATPGRMPPVVGLGGSAGGIAALQEFFGAMPANSGMAFVVILHLSPTHESILPEMLQRLTSMPVSAARDGVKVEPNCVYVIPPGKLLSSDDGHLHLSEPHNERARRGAVDVFFRTLADNHGPQSVAVLLSGGDGDGAMGIKRIKERGGLTIAQDPDEAEHSGMPLAAIRTGMIDWVLRIKEIPARLASYWERGAEPGLPDEREPHPASPLTDESETVLRDILAFLHTRTACDFSCYKRATISRRIARRMQVNGLEDLPGYLLHLRTHSGESGALLQDLLISVTNFFRDREAFEALEKIIPELFRGKAPGDTVRVWVAACATGEEAYSIAMLLCEHARTLPAPPQLQIFATDLDDAVIRSARVGFYPKSIAADVNEERIQRFFISEDDGYRVRREIRELVLFAPHDLLRDSPFSRIDLVSCRNLLIYLNREAQKRALEIFHFALRAGGRLFLGTSETVEDASVLFEVTDKKHRLYLQRPGLLPPIHMNAGMSTMARALELQQRTRERSAIPMNITHGEEEQPDAPLLKATGLSASELHYHLIERLSPPSILVNAAHEMVHLSETAGRFLHYSPGEPTRNILRAVHPSLRIELRAALYSAAHTQQPAAALGLEFGDGLIDLLVSPPDALIQDCLLVVFRERGAGTPVSVLTERKISSDHAAQRLEQALESTRARLRETIEESDASTEELKASNEELQAMNEELRSATEELETSREELNSINEELTTANQNLSGKIDQLAQANGDMQNLMSATDIATVFLDRELRIMRFTPSARTLFNFIPADVGRPLSDLQPTLDYPEMVSDAAQALRQLRTNEREVSAGERRFLARTLPYRTTDDRIAGVVITFLDITARLQSEAALRESEEEFRSLTEAVPQIVWATRPDGWNTYFNHRWVQYTGLSLSESHGHGWLTPFHPDDRAAAADAWRWAVEHHEVYSIECRLRRADGVHRWWLIRGAPQLDAAGNIRRWFGTCTDIDDLKQTGESLRLANLRLNTVMNSITDGLVMLDRDWRYTYVNDQAALLIGMPAEQLLGGCVWDLFPDARGTQFEEGYHRAVSTGQRVDLEGYYPAPIDKWLECHCYPSTEGLAVYFHDITARKQAEETLRRNENLFATLIEQAPLGLYVVNAEFRIQQVNSRALPAFGNIRPLVGRDFSEVMEILWGPEVGGECTRIFRHTLETGEPYISPPFKNQRHDVEMEQAVEWETQRLTLPGGEHGVVCYFTDVTERRRQEDALAKAKEAAETANASKDRFLAVLSHELRTPLTPVLMTVSALEHDPGLPAGLREDLIMIKRNVELETKLIDDLLDLSRIASGKVELRIEAVDLNGAVRDVCAICSPQMIEQGLHLETQLDEDTGLIAADPARLHQVLWNILRNAVKFTPRNGTIRVGTSRLGPDSCRIRISDSGMGIPADVLPRIFNAFEQGDVHVTRQFGGLGLGLAISRGIVELHGGSIRAESDGQGQGSTFIVEMPTKPEAEAAVTGVAPPPERNEAKKIRILLVEDHADTARTLARLLRGRGFEVHTAGDVAGAVTAAENGLFDLLVSDLGLPDGDGYHIMRAVRARLGIPGIAMSGYGMEEDLKRSAEAGFSEHLVKPVTISILIDAVLRVTRR